MNYMVEKKNLSRKRKKKKKSAGVNPAPPSREQNIVSIIKLA